MTRRVTAPHGRGGKHEDAPASALEAELAAALAEAREAAAAATRASVASAAAAENAVNAAARAEALLALAGRLPPPAPAAASAAAPGHLVHRVLPRRIIVIRHGESAGNLDESLYCRVPDPEIPLTRRGYDQGLAAGRRFRELMEADERETGIPGRLFLYVSPYRRSKQTAAAIVSQFPRSAIMGVREEPQLREQVGREQRPHRVRAVCLTCCSHPGLWQLSGPHAEAAREGGAPGVWQVFLVRALCRVCCSRAAQALTRVPASQPLPQRRERCRRV